MKRRPETITRQGQVYHYDPEYDCYYRQYTAQDLTHLNRFGWIYGVLILAIICWVTV